MKKLTIIVVTHNRLEYTKRTIDSLFSTMPFTASLLIVDNNSTEEGMSEYLSSIATGRKYTTLIRAKENRGWASAVNSVVDFMGRSKGDLSEYFLISNNDVEYKEGWFEKCLALYEKYPLIGLLGVWKHTSHGVKQEFEDLVVKDQMPAVGWLFKRENLNKLLPFEEKGPCSTKGGNGEDVSVCIRAENMGMWVAAPKEDVAVHIDGY